MYNEEPEYLINDDGYAFVERHGYFPMEANAC